MNQKKPSASTHRAGGGDEPPVERLKRKKKGKKGEDGDAILRRIAPATAM